MGALDRYIAKRNFKATPEPAGRKAPKSDPEIRSFVIQKHAARRLHYDLRLELDGTLKSWAVTNGPSLVPGKKRLAVETEDHPLDYATFEGVIPEGNYGAGRMIVWDRGRWIAEGDPRKGLAKGHLRFALAGEKISGRFDLVRMKGRASEKKTNWLLIKVEDDYAREEGDPDILEEAPQSVQSGRVIEALEDADTSKVTAAPDQPARRATRTRAAVMTTLAKATAAVTAKRPSRAKSKATLPDFIPPELAKPSHHIPTGKAWLHEIKFDGYRLQIHIANGSARVYTRSGLDWTDRFTGLAEAAAALPVTSAIVDGEAVVEASNGVSSFSDLQAALKDGRQAAIVLYAFDLLVRDGEDLREMPLDERKAKLFATLGDTKTGPIRASEHFDAGGESLRRNACRLGLEGVVSKRRDAPYRSGRSGNWVKIKCANRQEFVVVGFVPSTVAKRAIGSLALAVPEASGYRYVGKVGTGYTAQSARDIFEALEPHQVKSASAKVPKDADARSVKWVAPELVAEVEYRAITATGQLRHGSFVGLRADKSPAEVGAEPEAPSPPATAEAPARISVALTHEDRLYWPDRGLTKRGLADYYAEMWPRIAPHVTRRPLALVRCPDGIEGTCFFQKALWRGAHASIHKRPDEDDKEIIFIEDLDGLISLVQGGALEIHPWGSTVDDIERPDRIVLDLDPGPGVPWTETVRAACHIRDRLTDKGLKSFVKTTGGKGLHVVAPLTPSADWEIVKTFCRDLAEDMERAEPHRFISKATKAARKGLIFLDYLRNGRGATAIAAYVTRARPGAAISTPVSWQELDTLSGGDQFHIGNIFARLDGLTEDPWDGFFDIDQRIASPLVKRRRRKTP